MSKAIDKGFKKLTIQIVLLAVDDYRRLLRDKPPMVFQGCNVSIEELEEFFLSEWFCILTNLDGKTILNKLKKEYENECKAITTNT